MRLDKLSQLQVQVVVGWNQKFLDISENAEAAVLRLVEIRYPRIFDLISLRSTTAVTCVTSSSPSRCSSILMSRSCFAMSSTVVANFGSLASKAVASRMAESTASRIAACFAAARTTDASPADSGARPTPMTSSADAGRAANPAIRPKSNKRAPQLFRRCMAESPVSVLIEFDYNIACTDFLRGPVAPDTHAVRISAPVIREILRHQRCIRRHLPYRFQQCLLFDLTVVFQPMLDRML